MLNVKLSWYWTLFAFIYIGMFIYFIFSPIVGGGQPDFRVFLLLCIIGFIFVACCSMKTLENFINKNLPYKYQDIQTQYGNALLSLSVNVRNLNGVYNKHPFLSMLLKAKFELYGDFAVVRIVNRACIIKNIADIYLSENIYSCYEIEILNEDVRICLTADKQQYLQLKSYLDSLTI